MWVSPHFSAKVWIGAYFAWLLSARRETLLRASPVCSITNMITRSTWYGRSPLWTLCAAEMILQSCKCKTLMLVNEFLVWKDYQVHHGRAESPTGAVWIAGSNGCFDHNTKRCWPPSDFTGSGRNSVYLMIMFLVI